MLTQTRNEWVNWESASQQRDFKLLTSLLHHTSLLQSTGHQGRYCRPWGWCLWLSVSAVRGLMDTGTMDLFWFAAEVSWLFCSGARLQRGQGWDFCSSSSWASLKASQLCLPLQLGGNGVAWGMQIWWIFFVVVFYPLRLKYAIRCVQLVLWYLTCSYLYGKWL